MKLLPKDGLEKLEFDKILKLLQAQCTGSLGREAVLKVRPASDAAWIARKLSEVEECLATMEEGEERLPLAAYEDLEEIMRHLEVPGYVLPEEDLVLVNTTFRLIDAIFRFFTPERKQRYPHLYNLLRPHHFDAELMEQIEGVVDKEGQIKPDASPELMRIRQLIGNKQQELDKRFREIVAVYRKRGWLTDNVESFRNGRRVLSVPSEHKRKIRGIIHDESTTGKTAFIEPDEVIDINNDIFDLYTEEKREIHRILRELSNMLRPYVPAIRGYQVLLVTYDLVLAKARLARQMKAVKPKVRKEPHLGLIQARHPLLYLKNLKPGKQTVPFDLTLFGANRILVLSGPNAGGKSITMKAVGLIQVMYQSGMLVPVDEETEMGLFKQVFSDIGDQQSIEDDLSTYSSRLGNMQAFLQGADRNTLVLIDEFGSGTDPKIGGAIAEAILQELNKKRIFGLITTHYSNLKIFAYKTKGIVNGAMAFDSDTLSPTYQLQIGKPGSSYAFEIATKSGLHKGLLDYARKRTGKSEKAVDQLLVDLQREKAELEESLDRLHTRESQLEKLIRNYDQMHRDLEYRRKRMKLEARQQALQQSARDNRELEKLVREIREEKNLEKAKAKAAKIKEERAELSEKVETLKDELYYQDDEAKEIEVGDHVKMKAGGARGVVESIDKDKAIVQMGLMRMTVALRDLERAGEALEIRSTKSIQSSIMESSARFENKIDIRGMRMDEALRLLDSFLDKALLANASELRIVHGKGTGALRKAVRMKLREYELDMEVRHPEPEQGGDGVTLVSL